MSVGRDMSAQGRILDLIGQLDMTSAGLVLRSPQARRQRACELLLASDDPVLREIGEQVRDSRMRLADAIRVPAYGEAFARAAATAAERLDPEQVAERLAAYVARDRGTR